MRPTSLDRMSEPAAAGAADASAPTGGPSAAPITFAEALAALHDDDLAALLRQRPDVAVPPPADFEVLASRLSSRHSVSRVAETVDTFVLQILETLVVGSADEAELTWFCHVPVDDIRRATDLAVRLGLAWRDGDGRFSAVNGVRAAVGPYPLGLGRPFARLLAEVPQSSRRQMRDDLKLPDDVTPTEALTAFFGDPDALRALVAELPEGIRRLLTMLSRDNPVGAVDGRPALLPLVEAETALEICLAQGLLVAISSDAVEEPREVGLACRGDRPAGELNPRPPEIAGRRVGAEHVDAGGASAAMDALRLCEALLARWDTAPAPLTRAGGLPVRELRSAAKELGVEQQVIALIVQTVVAASLAGRTAGVDPVMVATERYDRWRDEPLAERWALLATAWAGMDQLPGLAVHEDGTKAAALLTYEMVRPGAGELRRDVLGALASASRGWSADPESLPGWLGWRAPTRSVSYVAQVTAWTLAEAQWLGVTGRGALTSAGRVLLDAADGPAARSGDEAAARTYRARVAEVLAPALPSPIEHVLIQADLTAVAPGPLRPPVARELALIADVESSGAATVYRFSESSLRRAFDIGRTAMELHQLIARLARGTVPQGLTYLIDDIARRHGRLRAGSASGYLRSDDPALLAEVVANRRTASAGFVLIAPTVAVSPLPPAEILAILRSAGYAPAGDRARRTTPGGAAGQGSTIDLDKVGGRRVPVAVARTYAGGWSTTGALPDAHVAQTVAMLRRVESLRSSGRARRSFTDGADGFSGSDGDPSEIANTPEDILRLLRASAADSGAVWISYVNAEGRRSRRTVHPTLVSGGFLIGYDDESGERRTFAISRIQEAADA